MLQYRPYGTYNGKELYHIFSSSGESMIVDKEEFIQFLAEFVKTVNIQIIENNK